MLEQYFGMKAKHPEAILLSRVGDFYEAYGEDAETIARALQIALTSKEAGGGQRVAMAGVPHHALAGYLAQARAAAIHRRARRAARSAAAQQAGAPRRRAPRDARDVDRGTAARRQAEQLSRRDRGGRRDVCAARTPTFRRGHAAATAISGEDAYDELLAELARIGPAEIVADVPADLRATIATAVEAMGARLATPSLGVGRGARRAASSTGFSLDESLAIHRALEALARVRQPHAASPTANADAIAPQLYRRRQFLALDPATRKHLELTRAQGQNPRATLLATLDRCATSMGSRMLARWILAPLVDASAIASGKTVVAALVGEHARRETHARDSQGRFDLERIAQKVRFRRATPRDLASLRRTLEMLATAARERRSPAFAHLARARRRFRRRCSTTCSERSSTSLRRRSADGGAIRPEGRTPSLPSASRCAPTLARSSPSSKQRERERTGIKTLKVKYASPFGYAIEVSRELRRRSAARVRAQADADERGERYVTPELKELELAISTAQARQERLERSSSKRCSNVSPRASDELLRAADAIAEIDVLGALAQCAAERGYVRPTLRRRELVCDRGRAVIRSWKRFCTQASSRTTSICASANVASSC